MATTHESGFLADRQQESFGPEIMFAAAILLAGSAWAVAGTTVAEELVLPLVSTLLFGLAAAAAVAGWNRAKADRRLSYWDVAGALTFIGICTSALIEPEQMLRVVASAPPGTQTPGD